MTLTLLFWLLMLFWFCHLIYGWRLVPTAPPSTRWWYAPAGELLLFAIIFVLGWAQFGPPLHR